MALNRQGAKGAKGWRQGRLFALRGRRKANTGHPSRDAQLWLQL